MAAVERAVNLSSTCLVLPSAWLLPHQSGEVFDSLDHYNRRLHGYALSKIE